MKSVLLAAVAAYAAFSAGSLWGNERSEQDNEAAAVFNGTLPKTMRGGTWKVVYSSDEGPEGRVLEVLTERLGPYVLREDRIATSFVLPLEKDGGEKVPTKRDMIVVGVPAKNATLRSLLAMSGGGRGTDGRYGVPNGGYLIRTFHEKGRNIVLIAGDTPSAVLWGTFDFLDVVVPPLEVKLADTNGRYAGTFFRAKKVPECEYATAPQTPVRSVFSWGHVVADYRDMFRSMARARFNRVILWNDQRIVNARKVIECAHSWGIEVFWGFSWGWTLSGKDGKGLDLGRLADGIVDEWRRVWKPMGGDGIYFQSFTETSRKKVAGRPLEEVVVELVNDVAGKIRAESPDIPIVFGLHSNSMKRKGAAEAIAKVDPSLEILWENCGGFPFWSRGGKPDVAFCDRILALNRLVGLVWKVQLHIDWPNYVSPAGPFLLGSAGRRILERDRAIAADRFALFEEEWVQNGRSAWELIRHVRAGGRPPKEFNAVVEYCPPYSFATQCTAELFWNSDDSWEEISKRARMRTRPER